MAVLLIEGGAEGRVHGLGQVETTIGRGLANTVVLREDHMASVRHATIRRTRDGYRISDHGSTNGISVNGQRVEEQLLADGDLIHIGGTDIRFRT